MANRYPLIYNTSANQLQELQAGDNLDLDSSGIVNLGSINASGIITASSFSGAFSGTATLASGLTGSPSITITGLSVSGISTFAQDINLNDNVKANFGDGDDLRIYHDGTNSYVEDTGAGDLYLSGSTNVIIQHHSTGETMAKFVGNGAAELYHDNSKKFETTSGGATVSGNLTVSGDFSVQGTTTTIDTVTLVVEDKNIGIGTTTTPSNTTADGGGLTIFGGLDGDKTLQWVNSTGRWTFGGGAVSASSFYGDGSTLSNVSAGLALQQSGSAVVGGAATTINFSGATISNVSSGIATITIASAGLGTEASTVSNAVVTLDLSKQDHKVTATGITTITVSGGLEGDSHTVRIVNSGIATVGFSTYFLFPSGSVPSLPTADGTINLISFTVHRVGAAGTQLLAGAGLNYQ